MEFSCGMKLFIHCEYFLFHIHNSCFSELKIFTRSALIFESSLHALLELLRLLVVMDEEVDPIENELSCEPSREGVVII